MNIDVEIYIKNFINFFENNPNDLMELIGVEFKEVFYEKVKELCYKNLESGQDLIPTKSQLIQLVAELKNLQKQEIKLEGVFFDTGYGLFSLN